MQSWSNHFRERRLTQRLRKRSPNVTNLIRSRQFAASSNISRNGYASGDNARHCLILLNSVCTRRRWLQSPTLHQQLATAGPKSIRPDFDSLASNNCLKRVHKALSGLVHGSISSEIWEACFRCVARSVKHYRITSRSRIKSTASYPGNKSPRAIDLAFVVLYKSAARMPSGILRCMGPDPGKRERRGPVGCPGVSIQQIRGPA